MPQLVSVYSVIWEISLSQRELPFSFLPHPFSTDTGSSPLFHKRIGYLYLLRDIQNFLNITYHCDQIFLIIAPQISATWSCIQVIISTAKQLIGNFPRSIFGTTRPDLTWIRQIYSTCFLLCCPLVSYLYWQLISVPEQCD